MKFSAHRQSIFLLSSILGASIVAWLDNSTHARMSFYLFYFPSIMIAGWYGNLKTVWMMVFLCSMAWFFTNPHWTSFPEDPILIWNLFIRIFTFTFVAWVTHTIKNTQQSLVGLHKRISNMLDSEREVSRIDYLTGALNSRAFEEKMIQERAQAKRYGHVTSLLYIDLDHFKEINDMHGHLFGDKMLKDVVSIINKNIREVDLAARIGGDEFVVLLPQTNQNKAESCARRILNQLNLNLPTPLTASIGMVLFGDISKTNMDIIKAADDAMYRAKRAGRNTLVSVGVDEEWLVKIQ